MRNAKSSGRPFAKGQRPSNFKDMVGQRCGLLAVRALAPSEGGKACWVCDCDCGNEVVLSGDVLRRGQYSCGCVRLGRRTHNMSETRVYRIWNGMRSRCTNPNIPVYIHYGGRGITLCERWRKFENFLADMGEPPNGHSIERRNNDGNYEPDNCLWLPMEKQAQNRRGNTYVEIGGETVCVAEAARRLGVGHATIRYRLKKAVHKKDISAPVGRDIFLTLNGETLNMTQWSAKLGIKRTTISERHKKGWSVERVLRVPA